MFFYIISRKFNIQSSQKVCKASDSICEKRKEIFQKEGFGNGGPFCSGRHGKEESVSDPVAVTDTNRSSAHNTRTNLHGKVRWKSSWEGHRARHADPWRHGRYGRNGRHGHGRNGRSRHGRTRNGRTRHGRTWRTRWAWRTRRHRWTWIICSMALTDYFILFYRYCNYIEYISFYIYIQLWQVDIKFCSQFVFQLIDSLLFFKNNLLKSVNLTMFNRSNR